jgi:acetyl esterase
VARFCLQPNGATSIWKWYYYSSMTKTIPRQPAPRKKKLTAKILWWSLGIAALLMTGGCGVFGISPWPATPLIRTAFDRGGWKVSRALEKHVPPGVGAMLDEHYDPADSDAYLDVFFPSTVAGSDHVLPTIVWVHGGGWISGSKGQIANYARILAGRGYTVVGVDYSLAPGKTYPTQIRQVNAAFSYLVHNAHRLHVDTNAFFVAGDSAGAQIAAVFANAVSAPGYAPQLNLTPSIRRAQLRGLILYCGPYNLTGGRAHGVVGNFMEAMPWSYSGSRDYEDDPNFATSSVIHYVTDDFPPVFISAGNDDPLESQSRTMAETLTALGVRVDSLFFPKDTKPALPHEYQFDLDTDAGRLALERSVKFVAEEMSR